MRKTQLLQKNTRYPPLSFLFSIFFISCIFSFCHFSSTVHILLWNRSGRPILMKLQWVLIRWHSEGENERRRGRRRDGRMDGWVKVAEGVVKREREWSRRRGWMEGGEPEPEGFRNRIWGMRQIRISVSVALTRCPCWALFLFFFRIFGSERRSRNNTSFLQLHFHCQTK